MKKTLFVVAELFSFVAALFFFFLFSSLAKILMLFQKNKEEMEMVFSYFWGKRILLDWPSFFFQNF